MKKKLFLLLIFIYIFMFGITNVSAADPVVKIGDKTYTSMNNAIKAAPNETKTTITVIKDFSDTFTIANNKDIVLDLNGYTLSNSKDATIITNNGILEVKNGTITSDAGSGMINNNKDAVFVMNSGSLIATGSRQALYNDAGNVTISGSAYLESATDVRATLHNKNSGIVTITGGTIVANNSYAIYNEKGTLNIGVKNDAFDKSSPIIQGATYGIVANNKFNFYDGIIKGVTYSIGKTSNSGNTPTVSDDIGETKVEDYEEDSVKELNEEVIDDVTYKTFTYELDNTNRIKIIFDPNGGEISKNYKWMYIGNPIGTLPEPSRVNYTFDGWFTSATEGSQINENTKPVEPTTYYAHWTYVDPNTVAYVEGVGSMSLKDAFAHGGNIRLDKDVIITESLLMNKETNLDLNGHTISLRDNKIQLVEKVTITDSSDSKNGKITSNANFTMIVGSEGNPTNGQLIVKGGTIEGLGENGAIYNFETVEVDGGTVRGRATTNSGYVIYNRNNLIVNSGTVYSENQTAIQNTTNSTFVMNGGLVKTDAERDQAINLVENREATINGGTIEAINTNGAGIATFGGSNLVVNDGIITGYDMAIAGNGNEINGNVNITINGGTLTATNGIGMYLPQRDSVTTINGGNISGGTGIEIRASVLIVNGGNITGTNPTYEVNKNDSGTTTKGAAIAVSQHNTKLPIVVMINGGNLKAVVPLTEENPQGNPPEALELIEIAITQGNFEAINGGQAIKTLDDIPIDPFITGGVYTTDPSEYVEDGYGVVTIPNGYLVTKIRNITIDSASTDLIELEKDNYPAQQEVQIKKLKEKLGYYTVVEAYDTNGNKLNVEVFNNKFIMPDSDIVLKVSYKKMINPETGDNIYLNILLLIISITGLTLITKKVKKA